MAAHQALPSWEVLIHCLPLATLYSEWWFFHAGKRCPFTGIFYRRNPFVIGILSSDITHYILLTDLLCKSRQRIRRKSHNPICRLGNPTGFSRKATTPIYWNIPIERWHRIAPTLKEWILLCWISRLRLSSWQSRTSHDLLAYCTSPGRSNFSNRYKRQISASHTAAATRLLKIKKFIWRKNQSSLKPYSRKLTPIEIYLVNCLKELHFQTLS